MQGKIHVSVHSCMNNYLRCTKCEMHDRVHKYVIRCTKKRVPRFLIFEALAMGNFDPFDAHLIPWCTQIMSQIFRYIENKCGILLIFRFRTYLIRFSAFYSDFCGQENLFTYLTPSWPSGLSKQALPNVQKIGYLQVFPRGGSEVSEKRK